MNGGGTAVDIGILARDWDVLEASTSNGWKYSCVQGDTTRTITQLDVAMDGLAAARARGRNGGRKPVMTLSKTSTAKSMYAAGTAVSEIASILGVSRPTIYRVLDR